MKKLLILLLVLASCTSCAALPAEERAFAVALLVEQTDEGFRVHARIPTYQTGGGYLTISGEGNSLNAAVADMDASAPMHVHLSQLRLLILHEGLGSGLAAVLHELSARADMRQDCTVAVTGESAKAVMDALQPETGSRLSKAIDVLLDARIRQGTILSATLADVIRMGERQGPVLAALMLEDGKLALSGGWPVTADFRLGELLSKEETALLALLRGDAKEQLLTLPGGSAKLRDASAKISLSEDMQSAGVVLTLRMTASTFTPDGLEEALATELLALLSRLSAQGCDVLGLGRRAILHASNMAEWHALEWPARYRSIRWTVSVGVRGPA